MGSPYNQVHNINNLYDDLNFSCNFDSLPIAGYNDQHRFYSLTTTGPTSTDTATTSIVITTTETTTLPVPTVSTVTTVTQTVSVRDSSFKYAADTLPPATFAKKKRLATKQGTSVNPSFKLPNPLGPYLGDVTCTVYQSQCAIVTQTSTTTTTLATTTLTSSFTSTVIVTSIPTANTTITSTSIATTTSTITPNPITVTSTVNTTTTTTIHVDPCSPSNIIGAINGMGLDGIGAGPSSDIDGVDIATSTSLDCCLAATSNSHAALWYWYGGTCHVVTTDTCSGIDQTKKTAQVYANSRYAPGSGFVVGNANCGLFYQWSAE